MVAAVVVLSYLALSAVVGFWLFTTRDRLVRSRMREDVIVTMTTGDAFRGILYAADGRTFILRDAKTLTDSSGRPVPVDGELILDRTRIDYFQRPDR
jgi:small nuclear ribonucleoprotein (snRNP)-like protein